ncbi:MAG TPA: sodium:solute symporter, partial [Pseudomonadales bacterium]|nr:sodium:solute symporter [Pseudomonadales bacterium]
NIWRQFFPRQGDKKELWTMRVSVLVFAIGVCTYAIALQGTPIYELVSGAYQVTLVGAFVPLVAGLYWKRASTQGAIFSIILGVLTWILFLATPAGETFPAQLAGFLMAWVGLVLGSLGPQTIRNRHGSHHHIVGVHG